MKESLKNLLDWMKEQGMVIAVYEEGKKHPLELSDKNSTIVEKYLNREVDVNSGKLQDIEANIKMLKEGNSITDMIMRLATFPMWFIKKEAWLELLEFERKQEIERLEFKQHLKDKYSKK